MSKITQKFLYIIPYWVGFPLSEYGGLVNVIGSTDEEVLTLLQAGADEWESNNLTIEWINKSERFELLNPIESRIVRTFLT